MDLYGAESVQSPRQPASGTGAHAFRGSYRRRAAAAETEAGERRSDGSSVYGFQTARHLQRPGRSKPRGPQPESTGGISRVLCGKRKVPNETALGGRQHAELLPSWAIHDHSRGNSESLWRGAANTAGLFAIKLL